MRNRCIIKKSNDAQLSYKINYSDAQTTIGGWTNIKLYYTIVLYFTYIHIPIVLHLMIFL